MNNPLVSIIVPAHNEEKTIGMTLQSLADQSYPSFEIIVVNNNSTDKTVSIAKKFTNKIVNEKQQGYPYAAKRGVKEAGGEVITICDADTLYKPEWLENAVKFFKKDAQVVAVYGPMLYLDGPIFTRTFTSVGYVIGCLFSHLLGVPITAGYNFLFKKSAYKMVGGYNPKKYNMVGVDLELGQRLKSVGKVRLFTHTIPYTSMRRVKKIPMWNQITFGLDAWLRFLLKKPQKVSYDTYNITAR